MATEFKVGDLVTPHEPGHPQIFGPMLTSNWYNANRGKSLTVKAVVSGFIITTDPGTSAADVIWRPGQLRLLSRPGALECSCDSLLLAAFGCYCGAYAKFKQDADKGGTP